ncbi:hypothetical protein [Rhizobium ruizarguesonis]|uniref:hypothetical protein n=1 Tax=Rhizobium ruizarguesonis TaxID=2081791 RepID=UPI001CF5C34C|nr:hypothetical protein [Rhizobium ruizarguesonis]MCB2403555.1 hypothetical protein [Rhizobium ruizarguesonis]
MTYFSEKEEGERPQEKEEIGEGTWGGIRALITARIDDGSFGATYPISCEDGRGPIGTDADTLWQAMRAEIPNLQERMLPPWYHREDMPRTLDVLDMIQFCWRCVGKPIQVSYHQHFQHHHLRFDVEEGRENFRIDANRILRRNGLAYELKEDGSIERLLPPMLREALTSAHFQTLDSELNRMLEAARSRILDPDEEIRREALEKLWDAWERLKTQGAGSDKKAQTNALLDATAGSSSPVLRKALENEAHELTWIGNNMQIRHSEKGKERVAKVEHVDYLFHRLFSLVQVILRTNKGL